MKLKEVQKGKKEETKKVVMTIRTSTDKSKWMKNHNVSPSLLFDKALEELMKGNSGRNLQ